MRLFDCCKKMKDKEKEKLKEKEKKPVIEVRREPFIPDDVKVILYPLWQNGGYHNSWGRQ